MGHDAAAQSNGPRASAPPFASWWPLPAARPPSVYYSATRLMQMHDLARVPARVSWHCLEAIVGGWARWIEVIGQVDLHWAAGWLGFDWG